MAVNFLFAVAAHAQVEEIVEGEVFVMFKTNVGEAEKDKVLEKYGLKLVKKYSELGFELYETELDTLEVIENLKKDRMVYQAGPNHIRSSKTIPNDSEYGSQWYLPKINWPDAWGRFTGTESVNVAVIDSGVSKSHNQLSDKITNYLEKDYYDNDLNAEDGFGHGTLVSGIIAAKVNDDSGVAGICPTANIVPLRVFNNAGVFAQTTSGTLIDAISSVNVLMSKVVNLSLGSPGYNFFEWLAFSAARSLGVVSGGPLFVCAAGNSGIDNDNFATYPASYDLDNIIAVASTDENDNLSFFSNYGSVSVDIAAPGQQIIGCDIKRTVVYDWTFDAGWEGWLVNVSFGFGWLLSNAFGSSLGDYGISTKGVNGSAGSYASSSRMTLYTPVINLAGKRSCRLEVVMGGSMGGGDFLDIWVMNADYTGAFKYDTLVGPGWAYKTIAKDISIFDDKYGRAALDLRANALGNGSFGIQRVRITALDLSEGAAGALQTSSGTSFAAPMVSGVAAMLFSQNTNLTTADVRQIILSTARKTSSLSGLVASSGVLDAGAAIREAQVRYGPAPVITSAKIVSGTVGTAFSYQITATGNPTRFAAEGRSNGLWVDGTTGTISGTPWAAGDFTIYISAMNPGGKGSSALTIQIAKAAPTILSEPRASSIAFGDTLSRSSLTGGSASVPGVFAWSTPSIIPIAGIPYLSVTFTPLDTEKYSIITLEIPVVVGLAITSDTSAVTILHGTNFSYSTAASGSPTSFGARGLPTGLRINTRTGLISGRPTRAGAFTVILQAMKKGAPTASATKVFNVVQSPNFAYAARINAKRNGNVNIRPKVAGFPAPSFSVVSGSLPPGLSLNATTAAITGKPTTVGTYNFTVRGANAAGNLDRSTTVVVK